MVKITIKERFQLLIGKKRLPKLMFLFRWMLGKNMRTELAEGYRFGEYYLIPRYSIKLPLPPNEAIQPYETTGMVELIVPERDMYQYFTYDKPKVLVVTKKAKEEGKLIWIAEPIISDDLKKVVHNEALFRHLHVSAQKDVEIERANLEPALRKVIMVVLILLAIIVFAIVLVVSSNAVVKIVAEAGNVADKWMTVVSQMGFNNITSSPAPATW